MIINIHDVVEAQLTKNATASTDVIKPGSVADLILTLRQADLNSIVRDEEGFPVKAYVNLPDFSVTIVREEKDG